MKKSCFFQTLIFCWAFQSFALITVDAGLLTNLFIGAVALTMKTTGEGSDSFVKTISGANQNLRFTDVVVTNNGSFERLGVVAEGYQSPSYVGAYNHSGLEWATALSYPLLINGTVHSVAYYPKAITSAAINTTHYYLTGGYVLRESMQHPAMAIHEEDSGALTDFIVLSDLKGQITDLDYSERDGGFVLVLASTLYDGKNAGMDMLRFDLNSSTNATYTYRWREQTQGNFTARNVAVDFVSYHQESIGSGGIFTGVHRFNATHRSMVVIHLFHEDHFRIANSYYVAEEDPRNLLPLSVAAHPSTRSKKGMRGYTIVGATEDPGQGSEAFLASFRNVKRITKNGDADRDLFEWAILVKSKGEEHGDHAFFDLVMPNSNELFAIGSMQDQNELQNMLLFRQRIKRGGEPPFQFQNDYVANHSAYIFSYGDYIIGEKMAYSVDGKNLYAAGSTLNSLAHKLDPILAKWEHGGPYNSKIDVEVVRVNLTRESLAGKIIYNEAAPHIERVSLSDIQVEMLSVGESRFSALWEERIEDKEKKKKDFWMETSGGAWAIFCIAAGSLLCICCTLSLYGGCGNRERLCFASKRCGKPCCAPYYECLQALKRWLCCCCRG